MAGDWVELCGGFFDPQDLANPTDQRSGIPPHPPSLYAGSWQIISLLQQGKQRRHAYMAWQKAVYFPFSIIIQLHLQWPHALLRSFVWIIPGTRNHIQPIKFY